MYNLCPNSWIFIPKKGLNYQELSCRRQKLQNFQQTRARANYLEFKLIIDIIDILQKLKYYFGITLHNEGLE